MQRHDVRPFQQVVQRHGKRAATGDLLAGQVGVVCEDGHAEGVRQPGDPSPDMADPDQSDGLAADLPAHDVFALETAFPAQPPA